jgi:hypothetical protein
MTTQTDTPGKPPRRGRGSTRRETFAQAHAAFLTRAQQWLTSRTGRPVRYPQDLTAVAAAAGVPCEQCGHLVRRRGDRGHDLIWQHLPGKHWAQGITVTCSVPVPARRGGR